MVTSDLLNKLLSVRTKLADALELDNELYGRDPRETSAAVAIIVNSLFGGELVQASGKWFNRLTEDDQQFDVDCSGTTGIHLTSTGELYRGTLVMQPEELREDDKELALSLAKIASVS